MLTQSNHLPPRDLLPSLGPMHIDSVNAEKLTSYICRISTAACLPVGCVIRNLIDPALNKATRGAISSADCHHMVNSFGSKAEAWVGALQTLTGRDDLEKLTMLPLRRAFGTKHSLVSPGRRWCPICLETDLQSGDPIYERLLWSITHVDHCAHHDCRLTNVCPTCGKKHLLEITTRQIPGFCSYCHSWLGGAVASQGSSEISINEYDRFVEDSFSCLIGSSHSIRENFDRSGIAASLRCLLDGTELTSRRISVFLGASHGIVNDWLSGKVFPSPANIFRICYCFDIAIVDFLTGCNDRFPSAASRELPTILRQQVKERRRSREINWSAVKFHLDAVVSGEITETSTLAIAKRFGLDTAQIYKRFGDEYRAASRICAEHRRTQHLAIRAARDRSLVSEVEAEVARLLSKGEFPAMKRILHTLVKRRIAVDRKRDRDIVSRVRRELLGL